MAGLARSIAAAMLLLSMTTLGYAADKVIIILDASGSMWAQIDGKPKLEIARESLRTVLQSTPADAEIGFMAYGHREKGSCDDIQLIVPPQPGSASAISAAADSLKFLGKTPLTAAVKQAAEALKYTEDKATVVLITDGLETCGGDPCALGKELEASGVDFTADVVGFGLTADEGKQIACLAENTGGKYIQASDEKALQDALVETVAAPAPAPAPEPTPAPAPAPAPEKPEFNFLPTAVLAEGGDPVTDGNAWEVYKAKSDGTRGDNVTTEYGAYKANLEPGDYIIVARDGEAKVEQTIKIEAGQVYKPLFILNAGMLIIHPRPSEGAEVVDGASVVIDYPGADMPATYYGTTKTVLPAGDQKVTVTIGQGVVTETMPLAAGKTVEKDVIAGVGHVVANAYYTAGGDKADGSGIGFKIVKAKKKIDGTRDEVTYAYGPDSKFDLPPGDYVLIATVDLAVVEQPFT
ncbi:VWA domain-containing protein, partial [Mesorhizobium sp.]|uniref:vWA domain-containing protein n=1 Tax=Mesorhizobium sp. TaxID=1871066 RepID=UPI003567E9BF